MLGIIQYLVSFFKTYKIRIFRTWGTHSQILTNSRIEILAGILPMNHPSPNTLDDVTHTYAWCAHPYIISLWREPQCDVIQNGGLLTFLVPQYTSFSVFLSLPAEDVRQSAAFCRTVWPCDFFFLHNPMVYGWVTSSSVPNRVNIFKPYEILDDPLHSNYRHVPILNDGVEHTGTCLHFWAAPYDSNLTFSVWMQTI